MSWERCNKVKLRGLDCNFLMTLLFPPKALHYSCLFILPPKPQALPLSFSLGKPPTHIRRTAAPWMTSTSSKTKVSTNHNPSLIEISKLAHLIFLILPVFPGHRYCEGFPDEFLRCQWWRQIYRHTCEISLAYFFSHLSYSELS